MKRIVFILLLALISMVSYADTIFRNSGDSVEGEIYRITNIGIWLIDFANEQRFIPIEEVDSVKLLLSDVIFDDFQQKNQKFSKRFHYYDNDSDKTFQRDSDPELQYYSISIYVKSPETKGKWKYYTGMPFRKYSYGELDAIERFWERESLNAEKKGNNRKYDVRIYAVKKLIL